MKFTGEFETHITVDIDGLVEVDRLQQWCIDRQLKFLHILLDPASDSSVECKTRSQPMLTRRGHGDFDDELNIANDISRALVAVGFPVVRIKLEAAPGNQDIPQSDLEAGSHPAERYFEHHVKLLLAPTANIIELREVVSQYSAHLSQNVLHIRSDLWQERFVTQRCMRFGRSNAQKQLQILLDSIASLGYNPIDIEAEFVVYDSNLALDRGWI
jgi:hypothetical protein